MIDKETFDLLCRSYAPLVEEIIKKDSKFYRFNDTIRWSFSYDDNVAIAGACSRNSNTVSLNLLFVMECVMNKNLKELEYFLLHEIRHAFQHSIIDDYKANREVSISKDLIEKWIYEGEHYITALDKNQNLNQEYFMQDSEMDAYAFSYAVMKYKYKDVTNLYLPESYKESFYELVDDWLNVFKEEGL